MDDHSLFLVWTFTIITNCVSLPKGICYLSLLSYLTQFHLHHSPHRLALRLICRRYPSTLNDCNERPAPPPPGFLLGRV
ncbi:hypothetical protein BKA57DRAFT_460326 [Linnemannia elongata]|nr:hypothetical protein BKA57DRAFT_460326 [Linnemannia elongata]